MKTKKKQHFFIVYELWYNGIFTHVVKTQIFNTANTFLGKL